MEPLESRAQEMVIEAMQRTLIKFRAMGIATNRLHSDRAKELLSRQMHKWCTTMGILQTFTAGDDPASNGHIESEVNQLKRKTRVKLAEAGCGREAWPMAMRYATEERRRQQLEALGVPMLPMIPFYATVYVKMKKWHKEGGLAAPFVRGRLLCPCPLMSGGWVVELTDGKILHVREAVQPNMEAEELRPLPDAGPEVALQLEEEPQPGKPTHRVVGKQPPTSEPQVPGPPRASNPTTGGASSPLSTSRKATSGGDAAASLDPQPVDKEDIWQDQPLDFPISSTATSARGVRAIRTLGTGEEEAQGYVGKRLVKFDKVQQVWEHQHEVAQAQLQQWLDYVPENEEQGRVQGNFVEHFVGWRDEIEGRLAELARKEQSERVRLARQAGDAVLQTVTVPLSEVRANPEEWKPAFEHEYNVLVGDTSAVRPVPRASLPHNTELVPGKMVCVRKGGTGAKRARAVICGNMATPGADPPPENSPGGAYASGADGTLIRAAIRQAAHQEWRVSSLDVKSAFLQAPRRT